MPRVPSTTMTRDQHSCQRGLDLPHARTRMQATQPFLVYRDRIGVASEVEFLRRQYVGFTRLHPVWTGRVLLPGAAAMGGPLLRIGGDGPLGPVRRLLFRQFGRVPSLVLPGYAPVLH